MKREMMTALALCLVMTGCTRASSKDEPEDRVRQGAARRIVPSDASLPRPPRVKHIVAGREHTCVLLEGGAVRCWGAGANGRLGTSATVNIGDNETPAKSPNVALGGRAVQISAGGEHTCALLDTGRVRCWGAGSRGQLGYGNTRDIGDDEPPASAGDVLLDDQAVRVTAGSEHTCALLTSGRVRCWGWNNEGQLGLGVLGYNIGAEEVPTSAPALEVGVVKQLVSALGTTCVLLEDGTVRCWGAVIVGDSDDVDEFTPAAEYPLVDLGVRAAALSDGGAAGHTCAITTAGRVRCWGLDNDVALGFTHDLIGVGVTRGELPTPAELGDVPVPGRVTQVAAGSEHTCVLLDTGRVRCWGSGRLGLLGPGQPSHVLAKDAAEIDIGGRVVEIASGAFHMCALLDTGGVRCWGNNDVGPLGYGTAENVGEERSPAEAGDVPL